MAERGINAIIPDNQFRSRDKMFADNGRFKPMPLKYKENDFLKNTADNTYEEKMLKAF